MAKHEKLGYVILLILWALVIWGLVGRRLW